MNTQCPAGPASGRGSGTTTTVIVTGCLRPSRPGSSVRPSSTSTCSSRTPSGNSRRATVVGRASSGSSDSASASSVARAVLEPVRRDRRCDHRRELGCSDGSTRRSASVVKVKLVFALAHGEPRGRAVAIGTLIGSGSGGPASASTMPVIVSTAATMLAMIGCLPSQPASHSGRGARRAAPSCC